ncbi:MAG: membrane-bound lytic murein transglycosylase MltF [Sterolibacterium sp.]|jgi:membrane-bound lytic murein transglycosylase F|nr:membrane-bound lytic murein transglycosylase MltF [Sterolibacterium sp.]
MRRVYGFVFHILLLVFLGTGCTRVKEALPRDELVVAIRDTPAFTQDEGGSGFERDLVDAFAQELGLKVRVILVHDHNQLIALLREGKAHFAASATVLDKLEGVRYTAPLRESQQLIVQSADAIAVDEPEKLEGRQIEALEGSPEAAALKVLSAQAGAASVNLGVGVVQAAEGAGSHAVNFSLTEQRGMSEIDLLARVSERKSELAATDRLHFDIASNFYPDLQVAQTLEGRVRFAWAFPEEGDPQLFEKAQQFIARTQQSGALARLDDRYFGHIHRLDQFSIASFLERIGSTLPRLRREFVAAQAVTGIDWRLLAAVAYQESLWNPLATSPTNVRGIMMLTEETADRLRVTNRLDAKQSIQAGSRYLADLIDELPREIPQPDRTWMGIAAYNLGQGHMNGARAIARSLKRDPTSWYEMKAVLPLMAREEYYKRLKSGRARGGEAVIMVENIRKFYDILSRFEPAQPGVGNLPAVTSAPGFLMGRSARTAGLKIAAREVATATVAELSSR